MFISFLHSAIRFSTIFLFGSTGETITEKSGHLNLGIPGIMCIGAIGGCIGERLYLSSLADMTQMSGFMAVFVPIIFSMLFAGCMGLLYSFMTVTLRCNQNVTGLTITTFGVGLTTFLGNTLNKEGFSQAAVYFRQGFNSSSDWFSQLFLTHGTLVYLAIIVAIITAVVLKKTRTGLNLRAIGENPATADAAGINVTAYKYCATILGAAIAGLGGLFYIMDYVGGSWEYNIDALGWLAVALVIFSVWKPNWGILGAILFGALYIAPYHIPSNNAQKELIKMLPYLVTIIVLIVTSIINKRETQPPAALGTSYFREER